MRAPRTRVEAVLAKIWEEVLELETVGVHDDFFDLGGQSLDATRIVARAREVFCVPLSLRVVLTDASTVAKLAEKILEDSQSRPEIERLAELWLRAARETEIALEESTAAPE